MSYEIDFLPIGKSTCGDSFALRFGDLESGDPSDQTVVLIDGGFTDDADLIKQHFDDWYGHNRIDLVISTHPDQDHINGLSGVVEKMDVGELWMHLPWEHSEVFLESKQMNFTSARLNEKLTKALQGSANLAEAASGKVSITKEPFAGETSFVTAHGKVTVIGPSRDYYESLLPQFLDWQPKVKTQLTAFEKLTKGFQKAAESFNIETLRDKGETSPQNNSSAMILIEYGDKKMLFTGDAGREAIDLACEELEYLGHQPGTYTVVQIPHHGSRHNVGPAVLDRLLGTKLPNDSTQRGHAYASAAKDCEDHPKKLVLNAFKRRGYPVISTEGFSRLIHSGGPDRGWGPSTPHPLYAEVEEDD
jgi:beta-lactamase superfamily II metal-dependent hydrolase